ARFLILYVKGTSEDPTTGAHEAFLEEVLPVADESRTFTTDQIADLISFVAPQPGPVTQPFSARALRERMVSSAESDIIRTHAKAPTAELHSWLQARVPTDLLPALALASCFDVERTTELEHLLDEVGVQHIRRALELTDATAVDSRFLRWLVQREQAG